MKVGQWLSDYACLQELLKSQLLFAWWTSCRRRFVWGWLVSDTRDSWHLADYLDSSFGRFPWLRVGSFCWGNSEDLLSVEPKTTKAAYASKAHLLPASDIYLPSSGNQ